MKTSANKCLTKDKLVVDVLQDPIKGKSMDINFHSCFCPSKICCLFTLLAGFQLGKKNFSSANRRGGTQCGTVERAILINMDPDSAPNCPVCIGEEALSKLIGMDHYSAPDCPVCKVEEDFSKFVKAKKFDANVNRAMWIVYILYALLAIAAVVGPFWVGSTTGNAIVGQGHQSHVASGDLTGRQSSIGLAKRLELIEILSKKIRLSLTESAHILTAKEADTNGVEYPYPGPSPSHDNLDSPPAASSSEKKPDAPVAPHPTGIGYLFQLIITAPLSSFVPPVLIFTLLTIGDYLSGTDSDDSGRDSGWGLLGSGTDSDDSGRDSGWGLLGSGTYSDDSGLDSGWRLLP